MSFDSVRQAVQDDPELVKELTAAKTPAARAAILEAHGIEKPNPNSQFPDMADTAGGGDTTDSIAAANATAAAA